MTVAATDEFRQNLLSTLACVTREDILQLSPHRPEQHQFSYLRAPETGMVMVTARSGGTGEPFNLGEVTVTRCSIRLDDGRIGLSWVRGRDHQHALLIALHDALGQNPELAEQLNQQLLQPLQKKLQQQKRQLQQLASRSKVEFFTLVRGED